MNSSSLFFPAGRMIPASSSLRRAATAALRLSSFGLLCTSLSAAVLLQHQGSHDPTTEGWTRLAGDPGMVGAAYTDGTTPVWQIHDGTSTTATRTLVYQSNLSSEATPFLTGWRMSVSVRIEGNNASLGANTQALFYADHDAAGTYSATTRTFYNLHFGTNSSGNMRVQLFQTGGNLVYNLTDSLFHEFTLEWKPGDTGVSFYIDGELQTDAYQGFTANGTQAPYLNFGDGNAGATTAKQNWALVKFEQIPEPGSVALFGSLAAPGLYWLTRRRRRSCGGAIPVDLG